MALAPSKRYQGIQTKYTCYKMEKQYYPTQDMLLQLHNPGVFLGLSTTMLVLERITHILLLKTYSSISIALKAVHTLLQEIRFNNSHLRTMNTDRWWL